MKPKELTVNVCQKLNTGDFSSKGFGFTLTVSLDDKDDLLATKEQLTRKLEQFLKFEVDKIKVVK